MSFQHLAKNLAANTVLSIIAPTASGKTALAYQLYETDKFELVSVDSALIYQDMNIGTAKPNTEELAQYPHYLVDIMTPEDGYNVAEFCQDVSTIIEKVHNNNKIPILVGGTMMYYNAMFNGISAVPSTTTETREQVKVWLDTQGIEDVYSYLQAHDALSATRLNICDTQRITRAVEVHMQTGTALSEWQQLPKNAISHNDQQNWQAYTVTPERAWLHQRIELRLEQMWQQGFIEEVIELIHNYQLTASTPAMRCIGYRQIIDTLLQQQLLIVENGLLKNTELLKERAQNSTLKASCIDGYTNSLLEKNACQDMRNKALYATRQLAKRQCTWLNKLNTLPDSSKVTTHAFTSIEEVKQRLI